MPSPRDRPGERPSRSVGDSAAERVLARLLLVDDGHELHVRVAEGDDPVFRSPPRMASSDVRLEAVERAGLGWLRDGEEDVVERQACEEAAPAPTASSDAWKSVLSILP